MLADFVLELVAAPGVATMALPGVAPAGRLTWASQYHTAQPVLYVLDDTTKEEWGIGTYTPGSPATISRDTVLGNSSGTTAKLNFAGSTRCYPGLPAEYLLPFLGNNVGRNLFDNSVFNVAQRGIGPFTTVGYIPGTIDRWATESVNGTRSVTLVTLSDSDRAALADESATQCLAYTFAGTAAAGDYEVLDQNIEGVRRTAGKIVTVSFWAQGSVSGLKLGVGWSQIFGTGGSATVATTAQQQTLTNFWGRYSATFVIPNVQGKTVGTGNTDLLRVRFWLSSGATFNAQAGSVGVQSGTIYFWGMQCEIGYIPTPLEKPAPDYELAQCQRYFQNVTSMLCAGTAPSAGNVVIDFTFPVTMRGVPTIAFSTIVYSNMSGLSLAVATNSHARILGIVTTGVGFGTATFNAAISAEV
jgi:hypothetical protein